MYEHEYEIVARRCMRYAMLFVECGCRPGDLAGALGDCAQDGNRSTLPAELSGSNIDTDMVSTVVDAAEKHSAHSRLFPSPL